MIDRAKDVLLIGSLATCVFLAGRLTAPDLSAAPTTSPSLSAPVGGALSAPAAGALSLPQGRSTKRGKTSGDLGKTLVYESGSGTSSSAHNFLAVTGSYGVGTSVLYLVDTERRQLAVYEARGGSQNSRRLTLVGARRIDLDLQLEGYNDESEWSYGDLLQKFERSAGPSTPTGTADPRKGDGKK